MYHFYSLTCRIFNISKIYVVDLDFTDLNIIILNKY